MNFVTETSISMIERLCASQKSVLTQLNSTTFSLKVYIEALKPFSLSRYDRHPKLSYDRLPTELLPSPY